MNNSQSQAKPRTIKNSLRTLLFAVLLIASQAVSAAEALFERISMEGVELVGGVTWGMVDKFTNMQTGFYTFSYDNRFDPDRTHPIIANKALGGCCYYDGKIYSNEFNMHQQDLKPMWRIYDASTFALLSEHELPSNCQSTTTAISYDRTTGFIYGLNKTYTESYLVKVNPATGEMTRVGTYLDRGNTYLGMAVSPKGEIFCTYLDRTTDAIYLGKIRKTDGRLAKIGTVIAKNLLDGDNFVNSSFDQAMFYNYATGRLYWMFQCPSNALDRSITAIYELNTSTREATLKAWMPYGLDAPGAFFVEPHEEAPAIIENFEWTPDAEGSQSGTISLTMPATTYAGAPLTGTLRLLVKEGTTTIVDTQVAAGTRFEEHLADLTNEWHELHITVAGSHGDGPTVKRRFFAGYDTPTVPTNIRLTADGLRTTLTWQAPTTGVGGNPINSSDLTYRITRYPGEITVAEACRDLEFQEDHPADMTRYVYTVAAIAGGHEGRGAFSNNLIVGTPLNVPYGGSFDTAYDFYNYYTIIDANADNSTWAYDQGSCKGLYEFNVNNAADDWLISPPINYQAGKTYQLRFSAYSSMPDYKEDMDVTLGDARTPEAQQHTLLQLRSMPTENESDAPDFYYADFSVPTDGVYYYGFHAVSPKFHYRLWLSDISVYEKSPDAIHSIGSNNVQPTITTQHRLLQVACAEACHIVVTDTLGNVVAHTYGNTLHTHLTPGIYVVKAGTHTKKVAVE